jgi:hypothetical protein
MMRILKKLFHRHKFLYVSKSEKFAGYFNGVGIYMVTTKCKCGKEETVMCDKIWNLKNQ